MVQSRVVGDTLPINVLPCFRQGIETAGGRVDEGRVHSAVRDGQVLQRLEERGVTADSDRKVQIGQLIVKEVHAHVVLRVLEALESSLWKRVHVDDACSFALCISEGSQHPRMVGAWVLTDDHNHIGLIEVRQANRALADANGASEGFPAGLVAHVRAVGRLLVPRLRTMSWYRKAASLLVRPEV